MDSYSLTITADPETGSATLVIESVAPEELDCEEIRIVADTDIYHPHLTNIFYVDPDLTIAPEGFCPGRIVCVKPQNPPPEPEE